MNDIVIDVSPSAARRLIALARTCGTAAALLGTAVLAGWVAGIERLPLPVIGTRAMVPNTALLFLLAGASLALLAGPPASGRRRRLGKLAAAAVVLLAGGTVAEYALGRDLGIDRLLLDRDPARPAVNTALCFLLLGAAFLHLDRGAPRRAFRLSDGLSLAAALAALLALEGYIYGAVYFYAPPPVAPAIGMAVHTSLGILVLVLGALSARPDAGLISILASSRVGGTAGRRVLPFILAIPLFTLVAVVGMHEGLYAPPGATVIASVVGIFTAAGAVLVIARSLNQTDERRTRAERELVRWKQFFENASFGAALVARDGTLELVNRACARIHGHSVEELAGRPLADLIPPDGRAELAERLAGVARSGLGRWEMQHARKDGARFPAAIDAAAARSESGEVLYYAIYVQDVTEEKRAEEDRSRLASLVRSAEDAIVAKTLDGTVVAWNRGAETIYGYSSDEMIGRSIRAIVPEDRREDYDRLEERVRRGELVRAVETVRIRKDGALIPISLTLSPIIDPSGRVLGISTIERDVSERKAAEQQLIRAREQEAAERAWLETVLDQTPEGVVLLDASGAIVRQNLVARRFATESGRTDLAHRPFAFDVRWPSGAPVPHEQLPSHRALTLGETTSNLELALAVPGGRLVPISVSAAPVRLDSARAGAVVIFRDITALKDLERLREEWTSIIAHDLRQPVTAILITAEVLRGAGRPPEEVAAVERIRKAARRLGRMIEDLLDASLIEAAHLVVARGRASVRGIIQDTLEGFPEVAARCRVDAPEDIGAFVDAGRVGQVVSNLLSNAAKYATPGTEIRIALERDGVDARVSITNEGRGIPPEEIPMLFERFMRTRGARADRSTSGLGLGLYIARGLVEAHGGRIWVESVPGGKTTFRFTLPGAPTPDRTRARDPDVPASRRGEG